MSVLYSFNYPHDDANEFVHMNFAYGPQFGTSISLIDISASDNVAFNSRSGTLPQRFGKFFINGTPQGVNRHRSYPILNYFTPTTSAYFFPYPMPRIVASFDVKVDIDFNDNIGQWFSLATFTSDYSNEFLDVIGVNINNEGAMNLAFKWTEFTKNDGINYEVYVYDQIYQETSISFPKKQWNRLEIYMDYYSTLSAATCVVYNNSVPVTWTSGAFSITYTSGNSAINFSHDVTDTRVSAIPPARLNMIKSTSGTTGTIITSPVVPLSAIGTSQMHFGFYSEPSITSGFCYNDNMVITIPQ